MKRPPRGSYGKPPTVLDTIGKRIRKVRMSWKWSQARFAEAIHINQKSLSRWEQDYQDPGETALGAISALFGLPVDALRTGEGFSIPSPPRQIGHMIVSESSDLVKLPPTGKSGFVMLNRADDRVEPMTPQNATKVIRKALEENRDLWLVVGDPRS